MTVELDYPGDLLGFAKDLTDPEREKLALLRAHLEEHVRPLIPERWERGETLEDIRKPLAALRLLDDPALLDADGKLRPLYRGFVTLELCRLDLAVSIVFGGQVGMFRRVINAGGSPEQVAEWDPRILDFSFTGCLALNEPDHGSDIAGGMATTARRVGDRWVLNGAKRWIGNATISDNIVVIAREADSPRVLAFVVPADAPGLERSVIPYKAAARMVHNADIVLTDVEVGEERRLPRIESFADMTRVFRPLRSDIAWSSAGMQLGAYAAAISYTSSRIQFGRPIAGFQLIQDKLVRIVAGIAQTLALAVRTTTHPIADDVSPSLVKLIAADRLREGVALAREAMGGNGLLLENDAIRFFADAEAMYTFEGTREMNTLIVGRALTGLSAFVR